jgi:DNA-binding HxlR family transcriptional regulator
MLTKIVRRDPPDVPVRTTRKRLSVGDQAILDEISTTALRPVEIARALDLTTQYVAVRIRELMDRGWVTRIPVPGGPPNGPGTAVYRASRVR